MATYTEPLNLKLPREMANAMKAAEKKTKVSRSELARDAITLGFKEAVARRLRQTKKSREMLAVAG